jgi:lipopolysaccharide/colanic/teichoic acid biosynthesis glycosyltransferase
VTRELAHGLSVLASTSATRILDVLFAGSGLVLLSPLMAVVAIAIWFDGGQPIFFSQLRIGLGGRHFRIYKFRKFYQQSGTAGHRLTLKDDRRLTRLGRVLEKTKIDELPQLWNILKGDMSIVGPRPETLDFADCFIGSYRRVLDHKPGIFGPNQVLFRNEGFLFPQTDPERFYRDVLFPLKGHIDLVYFPCRTMLLDVTWIVHGVFAVFGWRSLPTARLNRLLTGAVRSTGSSSL